MEKIHTLKNKKTTIPSVNIIKHVLLKKELESI